jgi:hypothetical protein
MQVDADDGVATVIVGDAVVALWQSPAAPHRWRRLMGLREGLVARHGSFVELSLILGSSTPPDGALRAEMQADFRRLGPTMRRLVVVPLGNSIWQAAVRAIVRGVLLVSGQSKQQIVAATVDEGITRLLETAGPASPGAGELRKAAASLAQALEVPPLDSRV